MATLMIRRKVEDYEKWRKLEDEAKQMAKSNGMKRSRGFTNSSNPNEVILLNEFEHLKDAKFAQSEDLNQIMQRAVSADIPTLFVLEEIENAIL